MKKTVTTRFGNTPSDDTNPGVERRWKGSTAWSALARVITIFLATLSVALLACSSSPPPPHINVAPARRILFIGNSLTYTNELPLVVQALADSSGGGPLEVSMVAFPDFSLDDHRQAGDASRAIAGSRWDVVVLQQGPSSLPESRQQLLASARAFAAEIRRAGARPAFYSVWPSAPRRRDFPRAMESYALAARETDGILFPVAAAWQEAWKRDSTLELYAADGLHPSEAGTYLAALVIHATLTGRSPVGSPARLRLRSGRVLEIGSAEAAQLQRAADHI
jgi:hypothetical protein